MSSKVERNVSFCNKILFHHQFLTFSVVIDYRNDPKASTGSFEMIYRQSIPPAPAYLGLNLFLKGTQVPSKSGGAAKKEKPKLELKPKTERKSSQLTVRAGQNGEMEKTPILSPRSLLIDFNDFNNNINGKKRFTAFSKSNTESVLKADKSLPTRMQSYLALTRYPPKHIDLKDPLSGRKPIPAKILDSSRRLASCNPKLMSIAPPPDDGKADKVIEIVENDRKTIKCVGNKCGPEVEITDVAKTIDFSKSSPRKTAQDVSSSSVGIRAKLKPVTAISKPAKNTPSAKEISSATTSSDYRKLLTRSSMQLNRIPTKHPMHSYNSHFYAVGLSLRAWHSKYNRIKDKSTSTPTSNHALKGKSQ